LRFYKKNYDTVAVVRNGKLHLITAAQKVEKIYRKYYFFFFAKLVFNLNTDSGSVHLLLLYSVHPTYGQLFLLHWQTQPPPAEVPAELKIKNNG
jgi:hypothetical protein